MRGLFAGSDAINCLTALPFAQDAIEPVATFVLYANRVTADVSGTVRRLITSDPFK